MLSLLIKRRIPIQVSLLLLLGSFASGGIIQNDVFWEDTDGNPMYVQRGGALKVGDTWYMYGAVYGSATSYYNEWTGKNVEHPGGSVAAYSSKDLSNWDFEGIVFTYRGGWFCGPNVAYNKNTEKYVLIAQAGYDVVFATSDSPSGPFTQESVQTPEPMVNGGTGDATTFIDVDGRPYVIASNRSGRSNVYVIPIRESDFLAVEPTIRIFRGAGREGNCMFEYKGRYFAASSDLHGWNTSHTYYISSDNIRGTYGQERIMENSDLDYSHVTQAGFFITVYGTVDTTVIYCGDRWSNNTNNGVGYNQWCPLTINGEEIIFNSMSQWHIDPITGTWEIGHGNNYILNPAFEADRITVGRVKGWEGDARNAGGDHVSDGPGDFVLSLGGGATARQRIPENPTIPDLPEGTFELKASIRSSGGGNCQISISDHGGSTLNESSSASSWTKISISDISITSGKAVVSASNTGGGTCQMDNFSLIRSDPPPAIKKGRWENQNFTFNPATYSIQSHGRIGETIGLEVYTVNGVNVLRQTVTPKSGTEQFRLPIEQFNSGNYFLKINSDGKSSALNFTVGR